jgi:hypothetical protein
MAALKDRARANCEVQPTSIAAIETGPLPVGDIFLTLAGRANDAVTPESAFKIMPCAFRVRNHLKQLKGGYCASTHTSDSSMKSQGTQVYNSLSISFSELEAKINI